MIIKRAVGIVSFGAYIPKTRIKISVIEKANNIKVGSVARSLGVSEKTVPILDEDAATLAVEAAKEAILRGKVDRSIINSLYIGSESHPYAVKPTGTMLSAALGLSEYVSLADLEFACKAGTQGLQISTAYCLAGLSKLSLAIGTDTAQAKPGDALEYTAGAGAAAFIVGKENLLARILATVSVATDTPDFWRRPKQNYPKHGGRFTGKPSYFYHIEKATQQIMKETSLKPESFDYCVFHTPNKKFPQRIAKKLGFKKDQLKHSLVVEQIGNTYSAASLIALVNVLEQAKPNQLILLTSYGSGAGADSFVIKTTSRLKGFNSKVKKTLLNQIKHKKIISYDRYLRLIMKRSH